MTTVLSLTLLALTTTAKAADEIPCWNVANSLKEWPELAAWKGLSGDVQPVAFCKLLFQCPDVGKALVSIGKNCTNDANDPDTLGPMCNAQTCAPAVESFYKAMPPHMWVGSIGGFGRRLAGVGPMPTGGVGINKENLAMLQSQLKNGVFQSAGKKVADCFHAAGIVESQLSLPISTQALTSNGQYSYQHIQASLCERTILQWLRQRTAYYSGYRLAMAKASQGNATGIIIAVVIGVLNLVCCVGFCVGCCVCIKKRACYRCMSTLAPSTLGCLEEMGCGPTEEQREAWGNLKRSQDKTEMSEFP